MTKSWEPRMEEFLDALEIDAPPSDLDVFRRFSPMVARWREEFPDFQAAMDLILDERDG